MAGIPLEGVPSIVYYVAARDALPPGAVLLRDLIAETAA
jgi:hypothetical protein